MRISFYDPRGRQVVDEPLLWADRLAVTLFIVISCFAVPVYILGNDAKAFFYFEVYVSVPIVALWFACRAVDFLFTGRVR